MLLALGAEAHVADEQFQRLRSTLKKLKALKFPFSTGSPTVSKRVGLNNNNNNNNNRTFVATLYYHGERRAK
jgi:hypothetical protein